MVTESIRKVVIFRIGSIGDFMIALPSLQLVRETYPAAEISLLTNDPVERRATPAREVLAGTDLVDRFFSYPSGTRNPRVLQELRTSLRAFAADLLIYLVSPRGIPSVYRDYLFFRTCGIHRIVGIPWRPSLWHFRRPAPGSALWEREAQRLARGLTTLGTIDFEQEGNWHLRLSAAEIAQAEDIIRSAMPTYANRAPRFLALSIGTKQEMNDWGDENWRAVVSALGQLGYGLVLVGGPEDRERSQHLADGWTGPNLNLCGTLPPRLSAAVLREAALLLCHDSGPMHLAAAVGTRCVAVFSRRNPPGQWFPLGSDHEILYPSSRHGSIQSIHPRQMITAAVAALAKRAPAFTSPQNPTLL
jgi:heptosyltransferase III